MRASDVSGLPGWARDMLREARVGHLALIDDRGLPRVLPVTFALHDGALYSAIDDKPKRVPPTRLARVRYLTRNPVAALTVDHYEDDWSRLAWVQALCRAAVVDTSGDRPALVALREKYEPYREAAPAGPLIRLVPDELLFWRAEPPGFSGRSSL